MTGRKNRYQPAGDTTAGQYKQRSGPLAETNHSDGQHNRPEMNPLVRDYLQRTADHEQCKGIQRSIDRRKNRQHHDREREKFNGIVVVSKVAAEIFRGNQRDRF